MDKDAQMIMLLLNTMKDLFKILRGMNADTELKALVGDIQDATKPYAHRLVEPGTITLTPDLVQMKSIRKSINGGESLSEILSSARAMLSFLRNKNERPFRKTSDLIEIQEWVDTDESGGTPPAVGSDNSDASNSPGGAEGGDSRTVDIVDGEEKDEDDQDGPPFNFGGSSSSDS